MKSETGKQEDHRPRHIHGVILSEGNYKYKDPVLEKTRKQVGER